MSEVKRYTQYRGKMAEREGGRYILASDFDAREAKWKEVVLELVDNCTSRFTEGGDVISHYVSKDILTKCLTKLFALLNDQPQEDKSHETNQP